MLAMLCDGESEVWPYVFMRSWPWSVVSMPNTLAMFSLLGTFLSPKDFANGAKYNKKYKNQDSSSNRADFDQAMQFHRDQVFSGVHIPSH